MSGKVRAEPAARLVDFLVARGASRERLLARAGIGASDLADPERLLAIEKLMKLADLAATELGDGCFGLHVGMMMDFRIMGAITYAVLNAPTVETALRNLERYARSHLRGPQIRLGVDGQEGRLAFVIDVPAGTPRRQHAEACAVFALRLMRRLIAPDWRPQRMLFAHDRPRDISEHERILGTSLWFRQGVHVACVFDAADLALPVRGADRRLLPIIEHHLDDLLAKPEVSDTWLDDVRSTVASTVCDGAPKIGAVARRLGMTVRTLQRRLEERGLVFRTVVEDVRRDLAVRYLADRRTRITEVAFLLGYSELSAFGRAFRRWTGSTPLAMRRSFKSTAATRV
jgi:AraC-like DNA-binding protein